MYNAEYYLLWYNIWIRDLYFIKRVMRLSKKKEYKKEVA